MSNGAILFRRKFETFREEPFFFILVINQLDAQNLFYNKFISCLYMFRAPCAPIGVMIPEAV